MVSLSALLKFSGECSVLFVLVDNQLGYIWIVNCVLPSMSVHFTKPLQCCFGSVLNVCRLGSKPSHG